MEVCTLSCRIMSSLPHATEAQSVSAPLQNGIRFFHFPISALRIGLPCGSLTHSEEREEYGLTTFRVSDNNGLGLSYPPAVIMSVQPHLHRELTDCIPFGSSLQPCSWSVALNIFWLVLRNDVYQTFMSVDHTIKSRPSTE